MHTIYFVNKCLSVGLNMNVLIQLVILVIPYFCNNHRNEIKLYMLRNLRPIMNIVRHFRVTL